MLYFMRLPQPILQLIKNWKKSINFRRNKTVKNKSE